MKISKSITTCKIVESAKAAQVGNNAEVVKVAKVAKSTNDKGWEVAKQMEISKICKTIKSSETVKVIKTSTYIDKHKSSMTY